MEEKKIRAKLLPQKKKILQTSGLKKKKRKLNALKIFHPPPVISYGLSLRIVKNTSDTHVLIR